MAIIYNSDLTKELTEGGKLQTARDVIPNQLADKVVPVMEVNPKLLRRLNFFKTAAAADAASTTVFTSAADKDTYISVITFSYKKDANATATNFNLLTTIDGATVRVLDVRMNTTTAAQDNIIIQFPIPLKVDRNVTFTISSDTAVASFRIGVCVHGYTVENIRA